ncbi:MAG: hypothetical protein E6R04_11915 [Spirochaetes bacterium]|nr:MAG: hypothetical protein E6R04_11915 [Spirochaetota bacterium]
MNKLSENYKVLSLIVPKSITATETGSAVNIEQYLDDALAIIHYGALGGTTETFDAKIQVSVDNSNWTDISPVAGQVTGTNGDNKIATIPVNLSGKKYVRAVITMSGSTASIVAASLLVKAAKGKSDLNSATPA